MTVSDLISILQLANPAAVVLIWDDELDAPPRKCVELRIQGVRAIELYTTPGGSATYQRLDDDAPTGEGQVMVPALILE
jgi:hypothetical protein